MNGNLEQGAAYVYVNNGEVWTQQSVLMAADGAEEDEVGYAVSISGCTVAIGAFGKTLNGSSQHGAVFVLDSNGGTWTQTAELTDASITGNESLAATLFSIRIMPEPCKLPCDMPYESGIVAQIAAPQATRLLHQAMQPLQATTFDPGRTITNPPGVKVECRSHAD